MSPRRTLPALVVALLTALLAAGCGMPTEGPVVTTEADGGDGGAAGVRSDARPPQPGASAADIVTGFLDAMTAFPVNVTVAEEYLSSDARGEWSPDNATITYGETSQPQAVLREGETEVALRLSDAQTLDARGSYVGRLGRLGERLRLPMVREGGEWRIARAPDALIVPATWFEQYFRQVALYFFDPTSQILVPQPVFVPEGEQLASTLVNALLVGPGPSLRQVVTTALPEGLQLALSVPISDDGVADVQLDGFSGQLTPEASELIVAQLAWTLRQEPTITALRVSIGGEPLVLSDGVSLFPVNDQGAEYDPTVLGASSLLYGLRDGMLVSGPPDTLAPVSGPLGKSDYDVRSVAVNLPATRAASVSSDGTTISLSSVRGQDGSVQPVASGAEDFLRPAWDFSDRLWMVDARASGARVSYLSDSGPVPVRVPGVTGEDVTRFLVSRDSTRLVAVIHGRNDRLVASRIRHDRTGHVLGATPARPLSVVGDPQLRVRDLGWATPTAVVVLSRVGAALWQVRPASVDGAPSAFDSTLTTLTGNVLGLAASPAPSQNLFAVTPHTLIDFTAGGAVGIDVDAGVDSLDYAG
jgi:hypothetical protein